MADFRSKPATATFPSEELGRLEVIATGNRCNRYYFGLSTPVARVAKTVMAPVRVERAAEDTSTGED